LIDGKSRKESEFSNWSGFLGAGTPLNLWGIGEREFALIRDQTAGSLAFGDATGFSQKTPCQVGSGVFKSRTPIGRRRI